MQTFIVDAFTSEPFKGNPAAVCICSTFPQDQQMQAIAAELGFSETAFVTPASQDKFLIRYFSPKIEIPLCGHATLASAKVLFHQNSTSFSHGPQNEKEPTGKTICFQTIDNLELVASQTSSGISMKFPAYDIRTIEPTPGLISSLGIHSVSDAFFCDETDMMMLVIESSEQVKQLKPNYGKLVTSHDPITGVIVTATADNEADDFDFCSRFFWPWVGTDEDPVTGSAHTVLAPYWGKQLGKKSLKAFQASSRTGELTINLIDETSLEITGKAQIILEGKLLI